MSNDMEKRLCALEDEVEIHRLAARFSDAVNERDAAAFEVTPPSASTAT